MNLARLMFGASGLGRRWGTPGHEAVARASARALIASGRPIDTSNAYAAGRSEQLLGHALRELSPADAADAATRIVTKVDADPRTGRLDRERVLRSVEESLGRLGVDRVPLLHLHDPYSITFAEAVSRGGAVEALAELRESGVAGAIGIAAGPVPLVARYADTGVFDAVLVHNRWTLVDRSARTFFERVSTQGMTVFNAAPFGGGLLAQGAASGATYAYRPVTTELRRWVAHVEALSARHGVALAAVALQFSLRAPFVHSTIVGASSAQRIAALDDLGEAVVPDELWTELAAMPPAPTVIDDEQEERR